MQPGDGRGLPRGPGRVPRGLYRRDGQHQQAVRRCRHRRDPGEGMPPHPKQVSAPPGAGGGTRMRADGPAMCAALQH
eukprot:158707-Chlamydomonas_euryale.AAC.2